MKIHHIIIIALFGAAWGFLEATLGGALHFARVPYTGTIMASIGFSILYAALRSGIHPAKLVIISLVAASFKFFDCFLFGLPVLDITVVNPATAIACQGLAAVIIFRKTAADDRALHLAPRMFAAAAVSMVLFNGVSLGVYGWPTYHTDHPWNAVFVQLPLMAIFATIVTKAICLLDGRWKFSLAPAWQAAAAISFAILAVIGRMYI